MRYPRINKQPHREVNIPQLTGGVNLRDSLTGIRDNQLTECVNMWHKDGMLRTRPSFATNEDMSVVTNAPHIFDIKTHSDIRNGESVLMSTGKFKKDDNGTWKWLIDFWWQYLDKNDAAGSITVDRSFSWESEEELREIEKGCNYFVAEKDGTAYCYMTDGESFCIKKLDYMSGSTQWEDIKDDEKYAPIVYAHCQRSGWDDFEGTQFEGYNLIGNSYKMIYSAYNEADSDKYHPMRYKLGQDLPDKGIIKVSITTCIKEGNETDENETKVITTEHIIRYKQKSSDEEAGIDAEGYECKDFKNGEIIIERFGEGNTSADGLRLFLKYNYVGFCFVTAQDGVEGKEFFVAVLDTDEKVKKYGCNEDNIIITAPYKVTDDWKKVFEMTRCTWFGGAANGINGGSRLFLCGNNQEKDKSLVVWSGLNNPLYFGENNYVYVGDKSQAVTAFGQQGENLIILKERSTYYSFYEQNSQIDADSLIGQSVVDYEANSVYFPIIQLNGSIGCDCPDTVQLCRNRLVWASSDGNVYTLYSNNQYSERTIYKVSEMVHSALKNENDLQNAVSCDFDGHYFLAVGSNIYVMDYNSYGYQYASSFSKNEDSNAQIPWWIWSLDGEKGTFYNLDNKLIFVSDFKPDERIVLGISVLAENSGEDQMFVENLENGTVNIERKKINSKMQTKLFDFSSAGCLKNIDRVVAGFGKNAGEVVNITFVTNVGSCSEEVTPTGVVANERDAAFVIMKKFYPNIRSVRTFGVKIECEGLLIVDGLLLQYRLLGGAK